ncbi:MAG: alanine racemase [Candidatus Delongbacteria bacterium]|nr:alanine racemase [Candidatus Delongbacteria bacterium]
MNKQILAYQNRPTRAIIDLANLRNNYKIVKTFIGDEVKVMGIIKANAYGHGMLTIAKSLIKLGVNYFGVAFLEEGIFLRNNGIDIPILVMGGINIEQIPEFIKYDIDITTSSLDKTTAISQTAVSLGKKAKVHLKIDTGMERLGVHWYNSEKFIEETYNSENIIVEGIFTHFAKLDNDKKFTEKQIKRFDKILNLMERNFLPVKYIHAANSAGIIDFPDSHYNMVRPGLMLYGYSDLPQDFKEELKPVMSLLTKVSYFKVISQSVGVSYNHTYTSDQQTRIVTLPIGYGDGYNRLLSNKGEVIIRGKKYPVVGNVCMDQMMVDVGANGEAFNGDDVLLFGKDENDQLRLEELCDKIGTIPYEVLTMISSRVPRVVVNKM